jgi:hypothetical protein
VFTAGGVQPQFGTAGALVAPENELRYPLVPAAEDLTLGFN